MTTVGTAREAHALRDAAARRLEFATHNFRVIDARSAWRQPEPLATQQERMRQRCLGFPVRPAAVEQLDAAVTAAPPGTALAMMHLVELCFTDTAFRLVVVDPAEEADLPPSFVETVQAIFDRVLVTEASQGAWLSVQLARPGPGRLERQLDHDLLAAIVDRGDKAIRGWRAWQARASLDHTPGFGEIAPMLSENLSRVGVEDGDTGRIEGIRRRAWYRNELLKRQVTTAVDGLMREGIDAVLLGDLPAAVRASETRSVRPVRVAELCVRPDEAVAAADVLIRLGWSPRNGTQPLQRRVDQHTWQRFVSASSLVLFLHWRPLPQRCSRLVAPADDDHGRVLLHGTEVATQSPTAQLLRLWARTGDPHPGHQLRTLCDTADVLERCSRQIDWARLWLECAHLDLVEYGEMYLRQLPAVVAETGLQELRTGGPR